MKQLIIAINCLGNNRQTECAKSKVSVTFYMDCVDVYWKYKGYALHCWRNIFWCLSIYYIAADVFVKETEYIQTCAKKQETLRENYKSEK